MIPENTGHGTLYLVPTPIGNMKDITHRALEVLAASELVACEDTRLSGRLLAHYGLKKKLLSYHDFNERARLPQLLNLLLSGADVSVVTDAGSPGLSDPAYRIIKAAIENGITVCPLPGPNALIPALTGSGLPLDRFFFEGFLPHKSGARKNRLAELKELEHTIIFYESPYRIEKSLLDVLDVFGNRQACIAREISKIHEEFIRGSVSEILKVVGSKKIKGEIVVVVEGAVREKRKKSD